MEIVLALAIILLAVTGLGLGLVIGHGPLQGSCGGIACVKGAACDSCPNREDARGT